MRRVFIILLLAFVRCGDPQLSEPSTVNELQSPGRTASPSVLVLGTLQDGGSPHAGCKKDCCRGLFENPDPARRVVSLGLVDPSVRKSWLFEATPDMASQMKALTRYSGFGTSELPNGIFLTHAHIGHYAGLMHLGREVMNAKDVEVYALPRMKNFLENNGPWSQLVSLKNIRLSELSTGLEKEISPSLTVKALTVPHRDEYSETAAYVIKGPNKKLLFIPDIDKWEKWDRSIENEIAKVDYAFIDATFYDEKEVNNRDIREIPHPFVIESLRKFRHLSSAEKAKIYFIHFNHTNPLLVDSSKAAAEVLRQGFNIASRGQVLSL